MKLTLDKGRVELRLPSNARFTTEDVLVLLLFYCMLLRTNKAIKIDLLSICLEDLRGPRKTVFSS